MRAKPRAGVLLEVCVSSVDEAVDAVEAGADRLELCAALEVGGLTPSIGLIRAVVDSVDQPVIVMMRPRVGDFRLTPREFATLVADTEAAADAGAAGVAFGALDRNCRVDARRCSELVDAAGDLDTVFHRAIDFVADPIAAIDVLAEAGVTRTLTGGGRGSAIDGADKICSMKERSAGTVQILPGGGVRSDSIRRLVERTGCDQVHLGPATYECDRAFAEADGPVLANLDALAANLFRRLDPDAVRATRDEIGAG